MLSKNKHWILITTLVFCCFSSFTAHAWKKVGETELRFWLWNIYHAELYTPDGHYRNLHSPQKLVLTYNIDITSETLTEQTLKQWQHLGFNHPDNLQWLAKLSSILPNIQQGDILAFELHTDLSATLHFNNQPHFSFKKSLQNSQFLAIWLSEYSQYPELAQALRGETKVKGIKQTEQLIKHPRVLEF
jgi:hypothetical protein